MTATPATSAYEIVLAVHVMAVVVAFGVTFAYPIMFAVTARSDPRALPLMHRVEYTIERTLINPVLGLVLIAGIFLASDGHQWGQFFVAWGVAAVVVIGAVVGSVLIPTAKRAETTAERDIAASTVDPVEMSEEYRMLTRRLQVVGTLLSLLVLVTILFMVIKP
jgi:phosphotransferase system  glucose/maltose/N-acetylglucosamine-specific IIC component